MRLVTRNTKILDVASHHFTAEIKHYLSEDILQQQTHI